MCIRDSCRVGTNLCYIIVVDKFIHFIDKKIIINDSVDLGMYNFHLFFSTGDFMKINPL